MPDSPSKKPSNFIGFRSKPLAEKLRKIAEANPDKPGLMSDILREAVEEKLNRLERGEGGLRVNVPAKDHPEAGRQTGNELADAEIEAAARRRAKRSKKAS